VIDIAPGAVVGEMATVHHARGATELHVVHWVRQYIHVQLEKLSGFARLFKRKLLSRSDIPMNAETLKSYPPEQRCFYLLGLQPGASRDEVRDAYRRLNLRYHPDRPGGGDANKFLLISKAYAEAVQVLEKGHLTTHSARTHEELRASAQSQVDEEKRVFHTLDPKNFDVKKFNEAFESFHVQEPWMRGGYDVTMGGSREEQPEIPMRPELQVARTPDAFRRAFEQELREKQGAMPRDLILFQDPLPIGGGVGGSLAGASGGWSPAVLGDTTDDFTDDGRYTDYMKAHTVYNTCTPALDMPIPERTLESYKASRENIAPMSDDERRYLEMREQERLQAEERRLARLREYDMESQKRYLESHKLMLGTDYKPT
jgi:hypothetical protein